MSSTTRNFKFLLLLPSTLWLASCVKTDQQTSRPAGTVADGHPGMVPSGPRVKLQYKLVDAHNNVKAFVIPITKNEFYKYVIDYRLIMVKDGKTYMSRTEYSPRVDTFTDPDSGRKKLRNELAPIKPGGKPLSLEFEGQQEYNTEWTFDNGETITGKLVAEDAAIDPDPPAVDDEVYIYYSSNKKMTEIKPFKYKVTNVEFSAVWVKDPLQGLKVKLEEKLEARLVQVQKQPFFGQFLLQETYTPVYKIDPQSKKQLLYGFLMPQSRQEDGLTYTIPLTLMSIHSLALRDIVRSRNRPTCDITATPAYLEWWRSSFCSASYVSQAIQTSIKYDKACALAASIRGKPMRDLRTCQQDEAIALIEASAKQRAASGTSDSNYACSAKWKQQAQEISKRYYEQNPPRQCDEQFVQKFLATHCLPKRQP